MKRKAARNVLAVVFLVGVTLVLMLVKRDPCAVETMSVTVRGSSLTGLIEDGARVLLARNYYKCHTVERGDIVAYQYAGDVSPTIKQVRGIPGDHFLLEPFQNRGYNLRLNGMLLMTTRDMPYLFSNQRAEILKLYERDYNHIIPADAYLILGNLPEGTVDSSRFGLVGKGDIIGLIETGN